MTPAPSRLLIWPLGDVLMGQPASEVGAGMGEYAFQGPEPKDMTGFDVTLLTGAVNNGLSLSITNIAVPETYTFTITDTIEVTVDMFAGVPRLSIGGLLDVVSSNPDKMGSKGRWLLETAGIEAEGSYSLFIETEANNPGPSDIPVPAALPLLVGGLALLGIIRRRA